MSEYALVAQGIEHRFPKLGVGGSSPLGSTRWQIRYCPLGSLAIKYSQYEIRKPESKYP